MKTSLAQFCILIDAGVLKSLPIMYHSGCLQISTEILVKILHLSITVGPRTWRIRKWAIKKSNNCNESKVFFCQGTQVLVKFTYFHNIQQEWSEKDSN